VKYLALIKTIRNIIIIIGSKIECYYILTVTQLLF